MKLPWSRISNLCLWLMFCGLVGTGLLLEFKLPRGSRGGAGLAAFGLSRHQWGDWHAWIALGFLAMILIHLAQHWRWLWKIAAQRSPWKLAAGIACGIAVIVAFWLLPIARQAGHSGPHQQVEYLGR